MAKNWKEIAQIQNWYLRMALALADTTSIEGSRLRTGFPQCFETETGEDEGPVPWSVLQEDHQQRSIASGSEYRLDEIDDDTLNEFNVPFVRWSLTEEGMRKYESPMLPQDARAQSHMFGDLMEVRGAKFVVVQFFDEVELTLVPIERVDRDA